MNKKTINIVNDYFIDYSLFIGAIYLILFHPLILIFIATLILIPLMGYGIFKLSINLQEQLESATPEIKSILKENFYGKIFICSGFIVFFLVILTSVLEGSIPIYPFSEILEDFINIFV